MAKITQAHKRKPIHEGAIFSVGGNSFSDGEWKFFTIGFKSEDDEDGNFIYTNLTIDRNEAERLVKDLTDYLNGKH